MRLINMACLRNNLHVTWGLFYIIENRVWGFGCFALASDI